ncbi:TonB-dependent siderophore receptor [Novosphingobium sp. Gsoil 351]|uniref:TonB-dependent receptor plug domain-containing protein n=1 Tax=Novosphingobium sp. Gsoil 351 TaxID=2675225 RepID=UPI0012B47758|nr:TonB-dependent receptor [Novosphingobium sp. Gsoil 351]QGN54301.1 TonB-dependent receptor [Novosphingobium sp. Gsoil 351]
MKYLILPVAALAGAAPAYAEDAIAAADSVRDESITVVATGDPIAVDRAGQPVSVIARDEIDRIQGADLIRVLERAPGVTITRNGGVGGFTGVRVRGADAEQLLVLIDGVRVADVASPGGGFDFGNLLAGGIDKLELLRGSNSVVWGSQAVGGVLAITSRELDGADASAEYGAHDSFDGSVAAGLAGDSYAITLNGGYNRTDGVSAAATGTEPDGFRQWRVGGRGRVEIASGLSATLTGRYVDGKLDLDGFQFVFPFGFIDTPEYQTTTEASGRAGLNYEAGSLRLAAGYAISDIRRANFDPTFGASPNFASKGRSERADLTGHLDLPASLSLDFGADSEWTRYSTTFDAKHTARLSSGHALLGYHANRINLAAGARIDDHSRFGSEVTLGANGSADMGGGWRVRASYGEGFKAPTLFQLLSDFGNAALSPERSRAYDIGIERGDRNAALHLALTAFRRDSRDLIDFVSCFGISGGICTNRPFGTYDNVKRARAEGIELELGAKLSGRFTAQAAYSYTRSRNRATGLDLARRPRHAVMVSADWATPLGGLALGGDLRLVGDSFDDAGNFSRLDGYALATVRASLPLGEQLELFARVENLTDAQYQTVAGYGTYGRSTYVGARARF